MVNLQCPPRNKIDLVRQNVKFCVPPIGLLDNADGKKAVPSSWLPVWAYMILRNAPGIRSDRPVGYYSFARFNMLRGQWIRWFWHHVAKETDANSLCGERDYHCVSWLHILSATRSHDTKTTRWCMRLKVWW